MRLILVRHGQTPSNVLGLLDTAPPGPGLTDLGVLQAEALPRALAEQPVTRLFASNQLRAQQTAAPLAAQRDLHVQILDGLREISAGDLEMASDRESVYRYMSTLFAWVGGDLGERVPGGPSGSEVLDRFDAAIDTIVEATGDGTALAVSHGGIIRVWAGLRAANLDASRDLARRHLDNTGAVTLERGSGGSWTVADWQEHAIGGAALESDAEAGPVA